MTRIPKWLQDVLSSNESKALDSPHDRHALALALSVGIEHERDQLKAQIATWLRNRGYDELAQVVLKGEWS